MFIDITIAVILIICIFLGDRRGFMRSLLGTFGWLISFCTAYFLRDPVGAYITERTSMHDDITVKITEFIKARLESAAAGDTAADGGTVSDTVASIVRKSADSAIQATAEKAAGPVADAVFALLVLVLTVVVIRIVIYVAEHFVLLFVDESKSLSSLDSVLGMVFSLIKGILLCLTLLTIVFIAAVLGNIEPLLDQISSSLVCTLLADTSIIPDVFTNFNVE